MKSKTLFSLVLFLFICLSNQLQAQYNMAAVNQIHMQHFQNMQMNMAMNAAMRKNANLLNNPKQTYKAVFPDGSTKIFRSKILFDDQNKSYLVYEDKKYKKGDSLRLQKIHPAMTQYISKLGEQQEELIKGLPADSCWMFKSVSGKVKIGRAHV